MSAPICNLRCAAAMLRTPVDVFVRVLLSLRWIHSVDGVLVPCSSRITDGVMAERPPEWAADAAFWTGPWFTAEGITRLRGLMLTTAPTAAPTTAETA